MIQYVLTPSAGKRLIAKAVLIHPAVNDAMKSGTIVIIAGTTNGYIAEELLNLLNQSEGFSRKRFFRGITTPPEIQTDGTGRMPDESEFPGDVVIESGKWIKGKTIFDVVDNLKKGDVILKGANCINLKRKNAGILIGHPKGGTIACALQVVVGKRVKLLIPAGLEKRVSDDIDSIAEQLNSPTSTGPRLLPVPGEIFTEIEAIKLFTGAQARLIAAGGICGAEGSIWLSIDGEEEQIKKAGVFLDSVVREPLFRM